MASSITDAEVEAVEVNVAAQEDQLLAAIRDSPNGSLADCGVSEGTLRRERSAAHPPVPVPAPAPAPGPTPVGSSVPGAGSSCDLGTITQNSPHIRSMPKMIDSSVKGSSSDSATFLPQG